MESATIRVSHLSPYTREEQLYALLSSYGSIRRIVMGISPLTLIPDGFALVQFDHATDAHDAIKCVAGAFLDERELQIGIHSESASLHSAGSVAAEAEDGQVHVFTSAAALRAEGSSFAPRCRACPPRQAARGRWDDPACNPHVGQAVAANSAYACLTDLPFDRVLRADAPRAEYRRRKGETKTVIHWGQRKLLLTELEFLTQHARLGHPVVYAGAAPGTHVAFLADAFPQLDFVLVDPAPFHSYLHNNPRIMLRQELFTDEVAREFAGSRPLFICDVRAADWELHSDEETERLVQQDMLAQQRWHLLMQPLKSLLKFRLPWFAGTTRYLAGDVYVQPFGPITTTETRLVPRGEEATEWDNKTYEEQMFHFNTVTRVALYPHCCDSDEARVCGLDHCYDCSAEVFILSVYLQSEWGARAGYALDESGVAATVVRLSKEISQVCAAGRSRSLADGNCDPEKRKKGIVAKQWAYRNGEAMPAYAAAKRARDDVDTQEKGARAAIEDKFARMLASGGDVGAARARLGEMIPDEQHAGTRGLGYSEQFEMESRLQGWALQQEQAGGEQEAAPSETPPREAPTRRAAESGEASALGASPSAAGGGEESCADCAAGRVNARDDKGRPHEVSATWQLKFSQSVKKHYYFCAETAETRWEPPDMDGYSVYPTKNAVDKVSGKHKPSYFYVNDTTGETQYEPPRLG
uniref:Cap-specific mRNA (nucleoside-2'-O-)-methyltransferase n=1 Tax=Calcidiscus leptoporus TaxID=127549 RepID=A0A7S0IU63_9EUKA|mmetsp:Transcript_22154/g.50926  ORF Transcript_22154/g.50926 Transcript_22154/m.50926 type:complete len:697 (+) Transcript_22154:22-2112(+)